MTKLAFLHKKMAFSFSKKNKVLKSLSLISSESDVIILWI